MGRRGKRGSRRRGEVPDGCLLVDKPPGMTSHDVVREVRRLAGTRQVGHTGTLDPKARGLLPIVVGAGCKLARYLQIEVKEYEFSLVLGARTETDDDEGAVVATGDARAVSRAELEAALEGFRGEIMQRPPRYSAIRVEGRRAYELAREGVDFELEPRPVTVYELELLGELAPVPGEPEQLRCVQARMRCSSGTYVRSLARDMGQTLGCQGHARDILRTAVGSFGLQEAHGLEAVEAQGVERLLMSPARMLAGLPRVVVDDEEQQRLIQGQALPVAATRLVAEGVVEVGAAVAALDEGGELVAVVEIDESRGGDELQVLRPRRVLKRG